MKPAGYESIFMMCWIVACECRDLSFPLSLTKIWFLFVISSDMQGEKWLINYRLVWSCLFWKMLFSAETRYSWKYACICLLVWFFIKVVIWSSWVRNFTLTVPLCSRVLQSRKIVAWNSIKIQIARLGGGDLIYKGMPPPCKRKHLIIVFLHLGMCISHD